jgi:ubiquinone/menaquinone biosynthesis C-methylase UbiE
MERVSAGVCQRAFSSPEAFAYEVCIASAVRQAVAHQVDGLLPEGLLLDVGAGGGSLAEALCGESRNVVAMDPSQSQTRRIARRHPRTGALWAVRAPAGALPFHADRFDAVISCCALKHWPDPVAGLVECARVAHRSAPIIVVEVDGASGEQDFAEFASSTRVPFGMKGAYTRFAMRTVVGVAPKRSRFEAYLQAAGVTIRSLDRIDGTPFLLANATK